MSAPDSSFSRDPRARPIAPASPRAPRTATIVLGLARLLLVLGLVALAAAAWWSWPRASARARRPPLRTVLVDVSRSARAPRSDWDGDVREELERQRLRAEDDGAEFAVITYGAGAEIVLPPTRAASVQVADLDARWPRAAASQAGSDLAAALDLADGLDLGGRSSTRMEPLLGSAPLPGSAPILGAGLDSETRGRSELAPAHGALVVLGDASFTGRDPGARLARRVQAGIRVERTALPPADRGDVAVGDLSAPRMLATGDALRVRAPLFLRAAGELARPIGVDASAVWEGGRSDRSFTSAPPLGGSLDPDGYIGWFAAIDFGRVGPGTVHVEVRARHEAGSRPPSRADADLALDDASSVDVVSGEKPVVLFAGEPSSSLAALAGTMSGDAAFVVEHAAAAELGDRLRHADVLVTGDLAPRDLPEADLAAFVRGGGGWLAFAEEHLVMDFAGRRGALDLLPLAPLDDSPPPRELVFLVDGSGSMAGETESALQRALIAVLDGLAPGETLEFRYFAAELGPALRCTSARDATARETFARSLVAEHAPGGPTRLVSALETWLGARARTDNAPPAIVFVFSDGKESETANSIERARALAKRAEAEHVRLIAIATGSDTDDALLTALSTTESVLLHAGSLTEPDTRDRLDRLLRRELSSVREAPPGQHAVRPQDDSSSPMAGDLARLVVSAQIALVPPPWPTIGTYLRARATPTADVLWRSETNDALLAMQRVGLGRTAACAFTLGERAPSWRDASMARLFVPLVTSLANGAARGPWLALSDGDLVLESTRPRTDWPARVVARVRALEADGSTSAAPVRELTLEPEFVPGRGPIARRAPWPDDLDQVGSRFEVELALDPPIARTLTIARDPEARWPRRFWSVPSSAGAIEPRPVDAVDADPRAEPALWTAMVLLALAGFVGGTRTLARRSNA